jgi:hypothetical protein
MWEHCNFDSKIFGCGKVHYSNFIWYKLSFSSADLKMSPIPTLALKSPKQFSYGIYRIYIPISDSCVLQFASMEKNQGMMK